MLQNRRRDNFNAIKDMRKMLHETKRLTLENFIMPKDENEYEDDYDEYDVDNNRQNDIDIKNKEKLGPQYDSDVKDAIIQIRKISIGVIAKLADNPTSESYTFMKRVLDMSDKAMESFNKAQEQRK